MRLRLICKIVFLRGLPKKGSLHQLFCEKVSEEGQFKSIWSVTQCNRQCLGKKKREVLSPYCKSQYHCQYMPTSLYLFLFVCLFVFFSFICNSTPTRLVWLQTHQWHRKYKIDRDPMKIWTFIVVLNTTLQFLQKTL